jgi:hypothetical protein
MKKQQILKQNTPISSQSTNNVSVNVIVPQAAPVAAPVPSITQSVVFQLPNGTIIPGVTPQPSCPTLAKVNDPTGEAMDPPPPYPN